MTCRTTCPYCGVGCGVLATPDDAGAVGIAGDKAHPANFGRLCSKGSALGETLDDGDRLLQPRIGTRRADWNEALDLVARRFGETIAAHGPDSVAFYVSGQLLTEDYYVANKLMKGFIGSGNIDTNSRLCMASTVAGHKRAFGTDTVPGCYEDLEEADLIVLVGSNLAWCHPVLFQRIAAAKDARPGLRIINVDPRRTATSELADIHLAIEPGSDVALFNALLARIAEADALDAAFLADHVSGLEAALEAAHADDPAATGLSPAAIAEFCAAWIGTEKVVTVFSQGVNQSSSGTDKVNAIINCHLATGRIGRAGMGPFSVTGQPNAMGGREVGGLANTLACHLDIAEPAHREAVKAFWNSPTMCSTQGLKAVDLFEACADGRIKALWIASTNPAVSLPRADAVRDAIAACDFVVVSDVTETDTTVLADVVLPAAAWGEKTGTVTNSERRISRQRAFRPAAGASRPDWRIYCDVATRMGWGDAFAWSGVADVFREYAELSGVAAGLGSDFDISGLEQISDAEYDALEPVQWPVPAPGRSQRRFFAKGGFFTPDGKGRMMPVTRRAMASTPSADYPLRVNTGRIRDHWHTMTRTGLSPRLSQHFAEPFAEIHPEDASAAGIRAADLVRVTAPDGSVVVRALVTPRVPVGSIFVPMHWTARYASSGRIGAAVAAETDPVSGQPESKGSVARIERIEPAWFGFAVSREAMVPDCTYWSRARIRDGWRAELAGLEAPEDWEDFALALFGEGRCASVTDAATRGIRLAVIGEDGLRGLLFAAPEPVAVSRAHVVSAFSADADVLDLLAGRPGAAQPDRGPTVCACFDIGANTIADAIRAKGLTTVEQVGELLAAGTNCGSCRPEIRALLTAATQRIAAE